MVQFTEKLNALPGEIGTLIAMAAALVLSAFCLFRLKARAEKSHRSHLVEIASSLGLPVYLFLLSLIVYSASTALDKAFNEEASLPPLHTALPVILVPFLLWTYFRIKKVYLEVIKERVRRGMYGVSLAQIDTLNKLVTALAVFIALIMMLKALGYDASVLLTIGGISGAVVGFATKDFTANFFGGLVIYLTKPFSVGDTIRIHERNIEGHVEEIGWYLTKITDSEKQPVHIPNSMFSQVILITPSKRSHRLLKETLTIQLRDFSNLEPLVAALKQQLATHPNIDPFQRLEVHFSGFDKSDINIDLFAYVKVASAEEFKRVKQRVLIEAKSIFLAHGADIAAGTLGIDVSKPVVVEMKGTPGE
ncbi:mechanosensitive ion channel family protein [Estrella lausannensis]|uniref:Mechanosensitive ion channel protein n=1 Tax=Estrella lausannensis TaxID=483423 RepID=A0A0H5E6V6_9BACT|nr:mechanosensitive ion channel domain-containing protein [Estrella lausannensis]CRX39025.1 Mechanosensitive ion channel protein [Estrella lausannensis]